jgi:hypothetical protein
MELLLAIAVNVVLGGLLLALLYFKHASDDVRLSSPEQALEIFRRDFPEARGTATLSAEGRCALVELAGGGGVGVLERHGRRWNARMLVAREFSSVRLDRDGCIRLKFTDFGWPRARFRACDPQERAHWLARLDALTARAAGRHRRDLGHA